MQNNSLLDKVLDNRDNPTSDSVLAPRDDEPHKLPNGSIIYDSTISAINRIFELNPNLNKRLSAKGKYCIYNGRDRVDLNNKQQLASLLHGDWTPRTDWQVTFLKEKVLEYAPELSFDMFEVSKNLYWDRKYSILRVMGERDKMRTVS